MITFRKLMVAKGKGMFISIDIILDGFRFAK